MHLKKIPKKTRKLSTFSDDENEIDLASKNIAEERKRAKPTSTKTTTKRAKVDVALSDGVDGASATKMGLKSSKMKPSATGAHKAESKSKRFAATSGSWTAEELLSNLQHIDRATSANIIRLFDEDNTIPFICRYRRELTGNMDADRWEDWNESVHVGTRTIIAVSFIFSLRDIKVSYNHIKNIQSRTETILKDLAKKNILTDQIRQEIVAAKSLDELDHLVSAISKLAPKDWNIRTKKRGLNWEVIFFPPS